MHARPLTVAALILLGTSPAAAAQAADFARPVPPAVETAPAAPPTEDPVPSASPEAAPSPGAAPAPGAVDPADPGPGADAPQESPDDVSETADGAESDTAVDTAIDEKPTSPPAEGTPPEPSAVPEAPRLERGNAPEPAAHAPRVAAVPSERPPAPAPGAPPAEAGSPSGSATGAAADPVLQHSAVTRVREIKAKERVAPGTVTVMPRTAPAPPEPERSPWWPFGVGAAGIAAAGVLTGGFGLAGTVRAIRGARRPA